MKLTASIPVEKFSLGQYDRIERWTGTEEVTLEGGRVLIGRDDNGVAFDLDELLAALLMLNDVDTRYAIRRQLGPIT